MSRHKKAAGSRALHRFASTSVLTGLGVIVVLIIVSATYYSRQPGWPTIQVHHETIEQRLAPIGAVYAGNAGHAALEKAKAAAAQDAPAK